MEFYTAERIFWITFLPPYFKDEECREIKWLFQNPIAKRWWSWALLQISGLGPFQFLILNWFFRKKTLSCEKIFIDLPGHSSVNASLHFPGELLGDMADPHSRLHGGEARSLLVFGACGQMLLEHGQLQRCHGILGRPQVRAVGNTVI